MGVLLAGVATAALVLLAAKAHGRQVRLEREAQGHMAVDFRGGNHPWVEALWRRDRRTFWPAFAALAAVAVGAGALAQDWALGLLAVAWAFAGAFAVAGMASLARSGRAARRGRSLGWWLAVLAAAGLVAWAQLS